ncbi:MAG: hypothetical protein CL624_01610 [Arcobacter sp.]|nr:hypothetical protein [Arcobacter sp.]|tara:strand:- start:399 stop:1355 length:957 start_codon:yes stop_codon:yes gene_type:complete
MNKIIFFFTILSIAFSTNTYAKNKKCVYINSYHSGYIWSDKISEEIKTILKDTCIVTTFDLNTKINKDIPSIKNKALEVKKMIDTLNPDIIIASDDNAAKYVLKPYFNDSSIPLVFCGINWSAKDYNFSYQNTTGILEILPISNLFKIAKSISGNKGLFLGDDTITDKKDLTKFIEYSKKHNIHLDNYLVNNIDAWKNKYLQAQENYDFIILGHNSSIKGWNDEEVKSFVLKNSKKLVLSTYSWMMPFSMVGLIIKAKEQGVWAGNTAKAILNGFAIKNIPVTSNKTWNNYVNIKLLNSANIKISRNLLIKSKKVEMK